MSLLCQITLEERVINLEARLAIIENLFTKNKRGPPLKKHLKVNNLCVKENIHLLKIFNDDKIWIILYNKDINKNIPILETDMNSLIVLRNKLMGENIVSFESYKLINRYASKESNVWKLV